MSIMNLITMINNALNSAADLWAGRHYSTYFVFGALNASAKQVARCAVHGTVVSGHCGGCKCIGLYSKYLQGVALKVCHGFVVLIRQRS